MNTNPGAAQNECNGD